MRTKSWRSLILVVMVEESIAYPTDILHLDEKEFRIRSNNPGGSVEIRLVRADSSAGSVVFLHRAEGGRGSQRSLDNAARD